MSALRASAPHPPHRRHRAKSGQAMVETAIVALFVFVAFCMIFQYADNMRAKLVAEYAAGRCARARTIGLNDYMVRKTANVATASAAGKCLTIDSSGNRLSARGVIGRFPGYLASTYHAQAEQALDFEYWNNGRTSVTAPLNGGKISATVTQRRPQFFSFADFFSPRNSGAFFGENANISGTFEIEAHYPDWMN